MIGCTYRNIVPEGTCGNPENKEVTIFGPLQAGHMLGSTMGFLSWDFQSKSLSSVFSFRGDCQAVLNSFVVRDTSAST